MTSSTLRIVTINGSPRNPSKTGVLIEAVIDRLREQLDVAVHRVEAANLVGKPLADVPDAASPELKADLHAIETADLIVAASPVYKGSYSGLFKYIVDLVDPYSLVDVPVIVAATGGSERHTLVIDHLFRPLFSFLQAATSPLGIYGHSSEFDAGTISSPALLARVHRATDQVVRSFVPGTSLRELNSSSL